MDSTSTPMGAAAGATPQPDKDQTETPVDSMAFDTAAPLDDVDTSVGGAVDFGAFDTSADFDTAAPLDDEATPTDTTEATEDAVADEPKVERSEIGEVTGLPDEDEDETEEETDPNAPRPDIDVPNNGSEFSPTFEVDAKELAKVADAKKENPKKTKKIVLMSVVGVLCVALVVTVGWFVRERTLRREGCFDGHCFAARIEGDLQSNHSDKNAIWYISNPNGNPKTYIYLDPGCIFAKTYENSETVKKEAKKLNYSSSEINMLDKVQIIDFNDTKAGLVKSGKTDWLFFCTEDSAYTWGIMSYDDSTVFDALRTSFSTREL